MQFSEQWLRSWVNPSLSSEQLSYLLTMAGLEVEDTVPAAPAFSGVVVAEVKEVAPHPNADRLRVTKVDAGTGELIQIVCGAPNVAVGLKVPCALPGAELPGDFKIKPTKMRGEASNGMLCSGRELGVPDDVDGLLVLPADAPVGTSIRDYLSLDDTLFTLKITPNRADCLSMRGIAREVAALTGEALKPVAISPVKPAHDETVAVRIDAQDGCGRYVGRKITGINAAAKTPDWMKQRLERAGLRAISAVVDITNYILLEQGQPMHAFNADAIQGGIHVRQARAGEQLLCLNDKTVTLDADFMVIADDSGALAIAGIMGGQPSSVDTATQNIFLESAFFAPEAIAGRARKLGFGSDSSYRYERGVDYQLQHAAIERATRLVLDICGGSAGPVKETTGKLPAAHGVRVRTERVNRVLGIQLHAEGIATILRRLGLDFTALPDGFAVDVPSFRFDLAIEEDLIEEIARVHGYDAIGADVPRSGQRMLPLPEERRPREDLRLRVAARDYQEIISYAFVDEAWERDLAGNADPVRLINPIAAQMSVMRSTLFGGLINTLAGNLNRKQPRVRLFEIARVFKKQGDDVAQPEKLAMLAWGTRQPEQWGAKTERVDFFDLKGDVEALLHPHQASFRKATHPALHPGRCAEIVVDGQAVGVIGELHPQWVQAYDLPNAPVLAEIDLAVLTRTERITARTVSKFQAVRRDLALLVDDSVEVGALLQTFADASSPIVQQVALFDVYRGAGVEAGKKSLAFGIQLQDPAKTLTDEEIENAVGQLLIAVSERHGAQLRL
ncbi:MAG: phenylalanine--tRNA ligase subunit beta [Paludibacterium sp.]|uniref:phenylalanine--tRNA ligase subunit beta n=1 Tax=Paludibacterium sp. TaxID=1917523 RepID=UPI0025EE047A|nr:phenylalanine--tRNA ligase subunit beta [Paludibacterium sp.]MBV8048983.1 phenylalanine--tRNA ligase subunit beta [Paludibacterium sp.]MBV8647500.1 phenylalanine--tRNA ligase subunit beta [Paludibacterium sp.]